MNACERSDVIKAQSGDHSAYERLYHVYKHRVLSVCLRIVRQREEAEDLLQQVFLQAYLKLYQFRGDSSIGTWLHGIALNECFQHLRKERRQSKCFQECYTSLLFHERNVHRNSRENPLRRLGV